MPSQSASALSSMSHTGSKQCSSASVITASRVWVCLEVDAEPLRQDVTQPENGIVGHFADDGLKLVPNGIALEADEQACCGTCRGCTRCRGR